MRSNQNRASAPCQTAPARDLQYDVIHERPTINSGATSTTPMAISSCVGRGFNPTWALQAASVRAGHARDLQYVAIHGRPTINSGATNTMPISS